MTSPSKARFVGGPLDGAVYKAHGVDWFPEFLRLPHGERLHLYRCQVVEINGRDRVRYLHRGHSNVGQESIS